MLIQILAHTPTWVFVVFGLLLAVGLKQLRGGTVGMTRLTIMPVVMTALAIFGVVSASGGSPLALLAWLCTAALVAIFVIRRPLPSTTRYDGAARQFHVAGSPVPLLLMMAIFFTKYAVGVEVAMQPELTRQLAFALGTSAVYGVFSGIFIGRAARLWRLARQTNASPADSAASASAGTAPIV
ncbi:conserved membrane hypothetical protein [Burkholderiales bacterium 8X]|nr:conserved membrane hypothetical protein [Burkholderiales bacterium 8X]